MCLPIYGYVLTNCYAWLVTFVNLQIDIFGSIFGPYLVEMFQKHYFKYLYRILRTNKSLIILPRYYPGIPSRIPLPYKYLPNQYPYPISGYYPRYSSGILNTRYLFPTLGGHSRFSQIKIFEIYFF